MFIARSMLDEVIIFLFYSCTLDTEFTTELILLDHRRFVQHHFNTTLNQVVQLIHVVTLRKNNVLFGPYKVTFVISSLN